LGGGLGVGGREVGEDSGGERSRERTTLTQQIDRHSTEKGTIVDGAMPPAQFLEGGFAFLRKAAWKEPILPIHIQ
jgi:hypothetical protein